MQPQIPASSLSWGLLLGAILRLNSAHRLEWLVRSADRKETGLATGFGDDALAYFTERVDPKVIRHRAATTLKLAMCNKVFEETAFIGLAIDGTGAGRTTKQACPLCHPLKDSQGKPTCQLHYFVMINVVGAGITLPFDVEPYGPGDSEYAAGKRVLKRSTEHLGPRFADYVGGTGGQSGATGGRRLLCGPSGDAGMGSGSSRALRDRGRGAMPFRRRSFYGRVRRQRRRREGTPRHPASRFDGDRGLKHGPPRRRAGLPGRAKDCRP
jgi:hypothetical protein